jgi:hypothetical protein
MVGAAIAIPISISIACRPTAIPGNELAHKPQKQQVFLRFCGEFKSRPLT